MAAAGATVVLGPDHSATRAFANAAQTMAKVDLWRARLGMKTLRLDQRQAIAAAAEGVGQPTVPAQRLARLPLRGGPAFEG